MKDQILALEQRLRQAQLNGDVKELDELISDNLQFVFFDGSVVSKADDLAAHKNKVVVFTKIIFTEQSIKCFDDFATVTVKAEVEAKIGEQVNHNFLRYGRTWAKVQGSWKIISGNVTQI